VVDFSYTEKAFLNGELKARFGGEIRGAGEELINFLLGLCNYPFDLICIFLGVVLEGRTDGAGNHTLELLLLLNFIAIISN
jgi:hypothetical protein